MPETLKIVVPLTPPSVNHYMSERVAMVKGKPMIMKYPSKEAKAWWAAVAAYSGGRVFVAKDFEIAYVVYQGAKERGDADNYGKCVFDSLVKAGVIDSDHKIFAMHGYKTRDRSNPRTEIFIRAAGQMNLLDPPMPKLEDF